MDKVRKTDSSKGAFAAFPLKEEKAGQKAWPKEPAQKDSFSQSPQTSLNLIPKQPEPAGRKWTVFNFLIQAPHTGQQPFDGVKPEKGEKLTVISAQMGFKGKLEKEFQYINGKQQALGLKAKQTDLPQFLKEQIKKYPAQHYMVAFDGHSSDFREILPEIAQGLKESGQKFAIIKFGSCSMAEADLAAQFKELADYYIASEGFSRSNPYLAALKAWGEKFTPALDSPLEVAEKIISQDKQRTHSIIDLQKFPTLLKTVKALGEEILKVKKAELPELKRIINKAQHYDQDYPLEKSPLLDIKGLALKLKSSSQFARKYPELVKAALNLSRQVEKEIVVKEMHRPGGQGEFLLTKIFPLLTAGIGVVFSLTGFPGIAGLSALLLRAYFPLMGGLMAKKALAEGLLYENIKVSSGLSCFLPVKPYRESYRYNPNLSFWPETGWDKVMDYLTSGDKL